PLDFSVADGQSFGGNAIVARLQGMTVAELRFEAAHLARRGADAPRGSDAVQIVLQFAGRSRVRQDPGSCTLEAGDRVLVGPGREYGLEIGRGTRLLIVQASRASCPGWFPALRALGGRSLPASGPGNIALAALTTMLHDAAAPLDVQSETTLHDLVVAMFERA